MRQPAVATLAVQVKLQGVAVPEKKREDGFSMNELEYMSITSNSNTSVLSVKIKEQSRETMTKEEIKKKYGSGGVGVLPTFLAWASNPGLLGPAKVIRIMADTGAQVSLIGQELAEKLKLNITPVKELGIASLGTEQACKVMGMAEIQLQSAFHEMCMPIITAYVVSKLLDGNVKSSPVHPLDLYPSIKKLKEPLADCWPQPDGARIDFILGQDYLWGVIPGSGKMSWTEERDLDGPCLWDTNFGIILQGWMSWGDCHTPFQVDLDGKMRALTSLKVPKLVDVSAQEKEPKLEKLLRKLFELEAFGIKEPADENLTPTQAYAVKYLNDNMSFDKESKKFVVKLPVNPRSPVLINNFRQAKARLDSLQRTLAKDPSKAELYAATMKKYLTEKHATLISKEDKKSETVFYLPHTPVYTQGAKGETKCRAVFDCSAKDVAGNSLNSTLVAGPVPDADLLRILTAWRSRAHALNCDVRSCFLNIKLHPSQQNLFRFLWSEDPAAEPQTYKFTSLIFGSSVSPWISSTCIFKVLSMWEDQEPELVRLLRRCIWVDDLLLPVDSVQAGRAVIKRIQAVFSTASFTLGKFVATAPEMLEDLDEEQKLFPQGQRESVKALGVKWNPDDTLGLATDFGTVFQKNDGQETKRTLARAVASVYDPLQVCLPWRIGGTILLAETWSLQHQEAEEAGVSKTAKHFWDKKLNDELQHKISEWKTNHERLAEIVVPRCMYDPEGDVVSQELYGFCDASPLAFGAVVYLKTCYSDREPTSWFVMARGKVNSKNYTLPRMELLGAKFLARLVTSTKEYLEKSEIEVHCLTDSAIVLHWLSRDPDSWKQFVSNQVRSIQSHTTREEWHHVPGVDNVADMLTRPKKVEELLQNMETWLQGPDFVKTGELPPQPDVFEQVKEQELEQRDNEAVLIVVGVAAPLAKVNDVIEQWTHEVSDVGKLLRRVALVRRAASRLFHIFTKGRYPERFKKEADRDGNLSADLEETESAYEELVRVIQRRNFKEDLQRLSSGQPVKMDSKLVDLKPFIDEKGLLRAQGRITGEETEHLSHQWLYPLILPSNDELLGRIILHIHCTNHHWGVDSMHAELRQRFWILRARATIRRYKNRCLICRRYDGKRLAPHMAPIPKMRLDVKSPPFTHVAMDGLGPLQIKDERGSTKKVWILVLSCLVTRGINLEILNDLSTPSFIMAIEHQVAAHGLPQLVRLDNLSSHVKMSRQITALQQTAVEDGWRKGLKEQGIKFSFSQVNTPSTNGIIERMVRTTKTCIIKSLHKKTVTKDELLLFLKQAKRVINSRPLTQVHQGETEDHLAVTPNHLIYGHKIDSLPLVADYKSDARKSVDKLWQERQQLHHQFTTLFMDGYLGDLRRVKKWRKLEDNIQTGDLVVVADPSHKRREWPIGVIEATESNKEDSVVRTVRVRLADKTVTRSVRSLIFLRHLPDYEPTKGQREEMYSGDQNHPARDAKMRFVTTK